MSAFLLLHGWQNRRPAGHWQRWLADELASGRGHDVSYPQLPDPDDPELESWTRELGSLLERFGEPSVVVCHSLGCLLWLHGVARGLVTEGAVERVLLVAPPSPAFVAGEPRIADFAPPALRPGQLGEARLVAGDDDPYCPEGALAAYGGPLGIATEVIAGGGHLSMDDGYGAWPAVREWCLGPAAGVRFG
ncbi:alpha/beta hydrolase [Streptomyces sp. NPDC001904]|uniref:RBBP9/YdeN family alpha/beta hydrolase n=1 Tax=Streptomyces sp. NPDC001904 TaxID=3154531 RepID=UPI003331AB42